MPREALTSPFLASGEAHKPNTATISRKSRLETAKSQTSSSHTNKLAATSGVEAAAGDDGGEVDTIPSFSQMHSPQRPAATLNLAANSTCRPEKQDMREFIAKKREIFLVMMTIDNKREELTKLQERASLREAAIVKGEQMLAEDAARFDAFLKDNDEKLQQVKRAADAEVKAKQEKMAEIKNLGALAAVSRSELNEIEEQLEECKVYREFLDRVTPHDWFQEEQAKKDRARAAQLDVWRAECQAILDRREQAKAAQAQAQDDFANARTQQEAEAAENSIAAAKAACEAALAEQVPPEPPLPPPDDTPKLFFQDPQQLLQIYARLEEENLFLIQATQEAEEGLEQAQEQLRRTQAAMDAQADTLDRQVQDLQQGLGSEQQRCRTLRGDTTYRSSAGGGTSARHHRASTAGGKARPDSSRDSRGSPTSPGRTRGSTPSHSQGVSPEVVHAKLREVYAKCGLDGDAGLTSVQMVAGLEAKLEELLLASEQLTPEAVLAGQRAREAARRKIMRDNKALQEAKEHDERVRRARERAAAPIFKKTGKPQMLRSLPLRAIKTKNMTPKDLENVELERFLAQDFSQL